MPRKKRKRIIIVNSKVCKCSESKKTTVSNVIYKNSSPSNLMNDTLKMLLSGLFSLLAFGSLFGVVGILIFGSEKVLKIQDVRIKIIYFLLLGIVILFLLLTLFNSKRFKVKDKIKRVKKENIIKTLTKQRNFIDIIKKTNFVPFFITFIIFLSYFLVSDKKTLTSVFYYVLYVFGGSVLTLLFFLLSSDVNKEKDKYYIVSFAAVVVAVLAIITSIIK